MSVISGIVGSNAQKSAANTAANASRDAAAQSAAIQRYMFDKMSELQQPYNQLGVEGLGDFRGSDPTAGAREYQAKIENMPELSLPDLNLGSFDFAFDPNDPTYKYRQQEMEKTINQAAAARGNYNSRPVINALAEGNTALTADESEKQFGRALDTYNTNIQTALSNYGADYQKSTDQYNTGYGKLTDLYNISSNIGSTDYNKIIDAIKIGQGSASSAGQGALATGQGLANTYGQLGNNIANSAIASGQATSDLWGSVANTNTNATTLALMSYAKKAGWI
jgi:hypothetical protein